MPTRSDVPRAKAFLERARLEAGRYGPDPWIFVRELLQNSRDAGAREVRFSVSEAGGREVVACLDNGEGMSFDHARRYLFALYASSKENSKNQAGKFGVGFWSILRFEPESITIRSRPQSGAGWGLRLSGSLEQAERVAPLEHPGTEITVERKGGDGRLEHRVFDAVWQSGRYLHRRDGPDHALPITVNGKTANAPFALEAPSAAFRRGSVRGVVGLGPAPRVELFSRGLRVRSAASLEDLIAPSGRHTSRMRVQFPELPGGLAPQALLESDKLEVMLSRSDARDNRALTKLVKLAQEELERLIDHQLSHARPRSWHQRAWEFVSDRFRDSLALRTLLGSVVGATIAAVIGWALWGMGEPVATTVAATNDNPVIDSPTSPVPPRIAEPRPYQDLGARYRGPKVDVLAPGAEEPVAMRYQPPKWRLHFASLRFSRLAPDGSPELTPIVKESVPYEGVTCNRDCVDVSVPLEGGPDPIRIAVPTGHRVVERSARLNGKPVEVLASTLGHPTVRLPAGSVATLTYQTVGAVDPSARATLRRSPALPAALVTEARLESGGIQERVDHVLALVQDKVAYDRTPHIATRHQAAMTSGSGFIARTLAIGAGDCDVQNGLMVALLQAVGIEARMAVGFIGSRGMVYPWLHAWVEYRDETGRWQVADASEGGGTPPPSVAVAQPAPANSDAAPGPSTPSVAPGPSAETVAESEGGPQPDLGASATPQRSASAPAPAPAGAQPPAAPDAGWVAQLRAFGSEHPWLLRGVPILLLVLAMLSLLRGRTRRAIKLDRGADLSRLLQGVLQQPGAFGQMSALFTRPLVPLISGDAISLNRARELASLGRLYRTELKPRIARSAMKAGAAVLDVNAPEGRTVADALGAVDLDRWAEWLDASVSTAVTQGLNSMLRSRGEDWGVLLTHDVPGTVAVLDLANLKAKIPRFRASRLVLLDMDAPWLRDAMAQATRHPRTSAFVLLDVVVDRLDLPTDRRSRLLSEGARTALLENFPA